MRLTRSIATFGIATTVSSAAFADVITDFNIVAIDAARVFANPNPATRAIAIGHLAAYDAINAITHAGESYLPLDVVVAARHTKSS